MAKNNHNLNQRGFLLLESAAAIFLISILMVSFTEIFFDCTLSILRSKEKARAFNRAQLYAEMLVNIEEDELFDKYSDNIIEEGEFDVKTRIDIITERKSGEEGSRGTLLITVLVLKNDEPLAELKTFKGAGWENAR